MVFSVHTSLPTASITQLKQLYCISIWYDTIEEFNVDSKAEYTA